MLEMCGNALEHGRGDLMFSFRSRRKKLYKTFLDNQLFKSS